MATPPDNPHSPYSTSPNGSDDERNRAWLKHENDVSNKTKETDAARVIKKEVIEVVKQLQNPPFTNRARKDIVNRIECAWAEVTGLRLEGVNDEFENAAHALLSALLEDFANDPEARLTRFEPTPNHIHATNKIWGAFMTAAEALVDEENPFIGAKDRQNVLANAHAVFQTKETRQAEAAMQIKQNVQNIVNDLQEPPSDDGKRQAIMENLNASWAEVASLDRQGANRDFEQAAYELHTALVQNVVHDPAATITRFAPTQGHIDATRNLWDAFMTAAEVLVGETIIEGNNRPSVLENARAVFRASNLNRMAAPVTAEKETVDKEHLTHTAAAFKKIKWV